MLETEARGDSVATSWGVVVGLRKSPPGAELPAPAQACPLAGQTPQPRALLPVTLGMKTRLAGSGCRRRDPLSWEEGHSSLGTDLA